MFYFKITKLDQNEKKKEQKNDECFSSRPVFYVDFFVC